MKRLVIITLFILNGIFPAAAQTYKQQFGELVAKKDTAAQLELLKKWEAAEPNDPELYVAYYNFYIERATTSVIEMGNNPRGEEVIVIKDPDSTKTEPLAYMYDGTYYDPEILNNAFKYIDIGIKRNPNRLDLWFGKVYMLGQVEYYESFTTEIIRVIDLSKVNGNKWLWTDNEPVVDPENFMNNTVREYFWQLYETGDDSLLSNMQRIAEAVLEVYPHRVETLSDLSFLYVFNKDYDKALEVLFKAEKLAPTDFIVLNNIGNAYENKADKKKALKYYELALKHADEDVKKELEEKIAKLKGGK